MMSPAQRAIEARNVSPLINLRLLGVILLATCTASVSSAQAPPMTPAGPPAGGQAPAQAPAPTPLQPGQVVQTPPTLRLTGFTATVSGDLSETYTSNAFGVGGTGAMAHQTDFVTTAGLNLAAHNHTLRFDGDMDLRVVGAFYANNPSYSSAYAYLNAVADAELVPEHLFFRGSAFAAPILVNDLGPIGAGGRPVAAGPNSGRRDMYGYTVAPTFAFRLGEFATSATSASQSSMFFVEPNTPLIDDGPIPGQEPPSGSLSYGASERISSGSAFFRLNWALTGSWYHTEQSSNLEFTQASGISDIRYAITREVVLLGTFGYQSLTSNQPLIEDLVGPIILGGAQVTLGPDFQISATAGKQFNNPSYIGNLIYRAGPFTTFTTSVTDTVTTPAGRLMSGLNQLGVNGQGNFVNTGYPVNPAVQPPTGSPVTGFNPVPIDGIGITNTIQRYRSVSSSLVYTAERTQYRLTGYATIYDTLTVLPTGIPPQGRARGGEFAVFRTMTPQLTGGFEVNYSVQDALGGTFDLLGGNIDVNYSISPLTSVFFQSAYIRRVASDDLLAVSPSSVDTSDTIVTIGIRRQIY